MPDLKIQLLDDRATIPYYQHPDDSGIDVYPLDHFFLEAGERKLIKLGFSLEIPEGYEIQIRSRSGLAIKHGVAVLNSPGTIDRGYTGEIGVILINHGTKGFFSDTSIAIAQLVLAPVVTAELTKVSFARITSRGDAGFGSTS